MNVTLVPGLPDDAMTCGTLCFRASRARTERHGFPPAFPRVETAIGLVSGLLSNPGYYSVIAELDGRTAGCSFLDERSPDTAAAGPVGIDPDAQDGGIGRLLMKDVLGRAEKMGFPGVRLVQEAYDGEALSLFAEFGFEALEPLALMQGARAAAQVPGRAVRPAALGDLEACGQVSAQVHGHPLRGELIDAMQAGTATLVERGGRITGYATAPGPFGHALGETNEDVKALIASAAECAAPGFLLPTLNGALLRWCRENGFREAAPYTLMSRGEYGEPRGAFLPAFP